MAAGQSSPPCAPPGLLLLLIGVISSVQARPTDFWCNRQARKNMEKMIEGLSTDVLQQKHSEVFEALRVFRHGVQRTKERSTSECQTSLLEKLEHHITNYVAIVSGLHIQNGTTTPSHSAAHNCSSVDSTSKVLKQYGNLLKGKLERLAVDLRDDVCKAEQGTVTTQERCS